MKWRASPAWLLLLALPAGFAGISKLQHQIDGQFASISEERDEVLLRSPKLIKWMSLEYAPLAADIYWTRVVQYYGHNHSRPQSKLELLWPLLDITTTLDANLLPAYRFGAMFLSPKPPAGAGQPDVAVKLIQRGIQENPDYWRFYQDLGAIYYFDVRDYPKAAAAFLEGSKKPDAKVWMKVMAARISAEGESLETSLFLWNDIYQTTSDPMVKENALKHLQMLRVKKDCRELDGLADDYEKRFGRRPARMSELVQAGFLRGIPGDPLGYAYVFSPEGKAELSVESPLREEQLLLQRIR